MRQSRRVCRRILVAGLVLLAHVPLAERASGEQDTGELIARRLMEQGVVTVLHRTHVTQARLGELAAERAHTSKVRLYGRLLQSDSRRADGTLMRLARRAGVPLLLPDPPPAAGVPAEAGEVPPHWRDTLSDRGARHAELISQLRHLEGPSFDREFLEAMVIANQEALAFLTTAEGPLRHPELKAWVAQMTPLVAQHEVLTSRLLTRVEEGR